jgi:hypothetical protein
LHELAKAVYQFLKIFLSTKEIEMNQIAETEITNITDPVLCNIAKWVRLQLELAVEKVAAHHADPTRFPLSTNTNSFEQILSGRFNSLSPAKRTAAANRALSRINATPSIRKRHYAELATIDLKSNVAIEEQAFSHAFPERLKITEAHLAGIQAISGQIFEPNNILQPDLFDAVIPVNVETLAKSAASSKCTKLAVRLHKIRCVDETDGFLGTEAGSDEIWLGGMTTDATGTVKKVGILHVGDGFEDNVSKFYKPPHTFCTFDLNKGAEFPKSFFVTFIMCEKDNGGFPEYLTKLFEAVKGYVASVIGASAGSLFGSFAGPAGAAIGAIVGAVIGWFTGLLKEIWEDDYFPLKTISVSIPSFNCSWAGQKQSPNKILKFIGIGGQYNLMYDWELLP